jgi:SAM-dependent methyltransferase
MKLAGSHDRIVEYCCNICGQHNGEPAYRFHREITACVSCGSIPRFRGIVHALCCEIFGQPTVLDDAPSNLPITGIGFSDSEIYARQLTRVFAYQNTYLDAKPQLDITDLVSCERYLPVDFVVCSEIFEHIVPPVTTAFEHLRALLRPGGLLVFSTLTTASEETVEHFPDFHSARIVELEGERVLVNRTKDGRVEVFENLLFHGGTGSVLEMRVFSEERLLEHLRGASFTDIQVYSHPKPEIGYLWGDLPHAIKSVGNMLGYILTARAA